MPRSLTLTIPQPCHEEWAAMTPAAAGRHCAACQKAVVDFTAMSDAEILAHLAGAEPGNTCGRFGASQLARPLQPLALAASSRWRAWLTAAVALWGLREVAANEAQAQAPTEQRELPANSPLNYSAKPDYERPTAIGVVRGIVVGSILDEGIPGVTILVQGTKLEAASLADGSFELLLPAEYRTQATVDIQFKSLGYVTQTRQVRVDGPALRISLQADVKGQLNEVIVAGGLRLRQPWPWHPRTLYYWITRPFRRS
jgi:hypothetical protein